MKRYLYFSLLITICSSCANPIYMPQDEHVAFVADKGDIGLSFNPILSNSPLQTQSSLAYCPVDKVEVNASAIIGNGYNNYTLGGSLFKKWDFLDSSTFIKFGGSTYFSWIKVQNFAQQDYFETLEGVAYLNQYKLQSYISYYGKHVELYFAAKGTIFDVKRFIIGNSYTIETVDRVLEREIKPIIESTFRLRLKAKYAHIYAGLNNVILGIPYGNPYYRNVTIYGGIQFQISDFFRQ